MIPLCIRTTHLFGYL